MVKGAKMSEMSEKGAKISRGRMRGSAIKKLATLQVMFGKLEAMDARQVTIMETEALKQTLRQAEESLKGYEEAIDRCLLIEDKEENPEDEHAIESEEISDKLDTLRNKTAGFLARIKEEQNVRTRENNAQGATQTQAGNMGRVTAKPIIAMPKKMPNTIDSIPRSWNHHSPSIDRRH